MIEYEWARKDGKFIAYVNDTIAGHKMVTIGLSHDKIRHNFTVLLQRAGKGNVANMKRYLQANDANPLLLERFGSLKRGGFLPKDFDIKSSKQIRLERIEKEKKDMKAFERFKSQKAKASRKSVMVEPDYDAYFTRTENGVVRVYGIKLVQEFKSKTNLLNDVVNNAVVSNAPSEYVDSIIR